MHGLSHWVRCQDETRKVEALLARRAALAQKKADLERRVRELGSLPADAFEKYRGQPLPQLHKLLEKTQAQLKKFQCAPRRKHLLSLLACWPARTLSSLLADAYIYKKCRCRLLLQLHKGICWRRCSRSSRRSNASPHKCSICAGFLLVQVSGQPARARISEISWPVAAAAAQAAGEGAASA